MDDLEAANASIRRGARLSQVLFPSFAVLGSAFFARIALQGDAAVPAVLVIAVILIAAVTTTVIIVQAGRLSRFQLTVDGIHSPDGSHLPWSAITRARSFNGSLFLYDSAGGEMRVPIMLATSQAKVLAAIRARLPRGMQIENSP
jgi:hypothetical protein